MTRMIFNMWLVKHYPIPWMEIHDITQGLFLLLFKNKFWTCYFRWLAPTIWISIHFQFPIRKKPDLINFTPPLNSTPCYHNLKQKSASRWNQAYRVMLRKCRLIFVSSIKLWSVFSRFSLFLEKRDSVGHVD